MRGRVMALYSVVFLGSTPIGGPIVGWLAEVAGPRSGSCSPGSRRSPPGSAARSPSPAGAIPSSAPCDVATRPRRAAAGAASRSGRGRGRGRGCGSASRARRPRRARRRSGRRRAPRSRRRRARGRARRARSGSRSRRRSRRPAGAEPARDARRSSAKAPIGHRRMNAIRPGLSGGRLVAVRAPASSRAIASAARAGRPSQMPIAAPAIHQPAATASANSLASWLATIDGDRAERGRDAGDQQDRDAQQVAEQHLEQAPQQVEERLRPGDDEVGAVLDLRRRLGGGDADADRVLELPARRPARAGRRRRRGRCGRRRRTARSSPPPPRTSRRTAIPLWTVASGRTSSTMRPEVRDQALLLGEHGDLARPLRRGSGVGGAAPVDRLDRALVLEPQADRRRAGPSRGARRTRPPPSRGGRARGSRRGPRVARAEQLEPVVAGVGERVDPDHPPGGARPAAADAGDEPVAAGELGEHRRGPPAARSRPRGRRRSAPGCRRCRRGSPRRPDRPAAARGSGRRRRWRHGT